MAGSGTVIADEGARATIEGLDYDSTAAALTFAALEGVTMEQALGLSRLGGAESDRPASAPSAADRGRRCGCR